jgi:hypothetical protein
VSRVKTAIGRNKLPVAYDFDMYSDGVCITEVIVNGIDIFDVLTEDTIKELEQDSIAWLREP